MSKFRFKNLEKLSSSKSGNKYSIAISLPKTKKQMSLRQCQNNDCSPKTFHLGEINDEIKKPIDNQIIKRLPGTPGTTCPYCGTDGDDNSFIHEQDFEYAKDIATNAAITDIENEISKMFNGLGKGFNSRKSGISFKVKKSPPKTLKKPRAFRKDMLRNLACYNCGREYGVYAIGLFCPDCGTPNFCTHFEREVDLIIKQLIDAEKYKNTDEEYWYRLAGNAHEDVLGAFEAYQKAIYKYLFKRKYPFQPNEEIEKIFSKLGNSFQNSEKAQKQYDRIEISPFKCLTNEETELLNLYSQKRHIIGHNLGMMDKKYVKQTLSKGEDTPVNICEQEIKDFLQICSKVVVKLESHLT